MLKFAMVRGIFVGAREHFDGLMRAVAVNELKPVIDGCSSSTRRSRRYKYLKSAQHFGKVVIKI